MSAAQNPSLLAFHGDVSIHYLDGTVIAGEFITQDIYNIFLQVEGEHLMIPRAQIRYVKAVHHQQITVDNSQDMLVPAAVEEEDDPTSPGHPPTPGEDATFEMPSLKVEKEEDGTVALPSDTESPFSVEEEDDKTFVLPTDAEDFQYEDEEDATFVLPPEGVATYEEDDEDGTVVLPAAALDEYEAEDDEEDSTVVITQDELPQISVKLTCTAGPHSGQIFTFMAADRITLGRSSDNMVVLSSDKEISRHHAIIYKEADQYVVKDQDSLNGTFVNNEPVAQPRQLKADDEILVGISLLKYQEE